MNSTDSNSTLLEYLSTESINSESDLPEHPFTEEQRRYLRIVNATTPLSDTIRTQALRPSRPPKRHYLSRLTVSAATTMRRQVSDFSVHQRVHQ
jgi:hypothetical protein